MATDDGGAAYPWRQPQEQDGRWQQEGWGDGMTLLDHYVGIAWSRMLEADLRKAFDDRDAPEKLVKAAYIEAKAVIEEKRRLEKEATDGKQ